MQRRVVLHQGVAAVPVDRAVDASPRPAAPRPRSCAGRPGLASDLDHLALLLGAVRSGPGQGAGVVRLAAAGGVEGRPIEDHRAVADLLHGGVHLLEVGVGGVEQLGHRASARRLYQSPHRPPSARVRQARSIGGPQEVTEILDGKLAPRPLERQRARAPQRPDPASRSVSGTIEHAGMRTTFAPQNSSRQSRSRFRLRGDDASPSMAACTSCSFIGPLPRRSVLLDADDIQTQVRDAISAISVEDPRRSDTASRAIRRFA